MSMFMLKLLLMDHLPLLLTTKLSYLLTLLLTLHLEPNKLLYTKKQLPLSSQSSIQVHQLTISELSSALRDLEASQGLRAMMIQALRKKTPLPLERSQLRDKPFSPLSPKLRVNSKLFIQLVPKTLLL